MMRCPGFFPAFLLVLFCALPCPAADKTASFSADTPEPPRFAVRSHSLIDKSQGGKPLFFQGIGYSPFLIGTTPLKGASPQNGPHLARDLAMMRALGVNYVHVFPRHMPGTFFTALDEENLLYGQDIWLPSEPDLLNEAYLARQLATIKDVIDHNYAHGRPARLVLFSVGDELQASAVTQTNAAHPDVHSYAGKHLSMQHRKAAEVAMAKLIDQAIDYELSRYGQRHLYCHTSWTHIGPISDRPDLELAPEDAFTPDMGDLLCMNIYSYANAVKTSGPGRTTGTSYQGYLEQLAWESHKPILISQVGLSTSPIEPKPQQVPGFGGHNEADVPQAFSALWQDLKSARGREHFCGFVFFEWQDEWWKSGEKPDDALSHEAEDPEEWFGLYALGPDNQLLPKGDIPATVGRLFTDQNITFSKEGGQQAGPADAGKK